MCDPQNFGAAPLADALGRHCAARRARFHTPGHKGEPSSPLYPFFGGGLRWDLTELPDTDSLFEASGPILSAERLAARQFGTRETLLSAGGATLCIQAMLRLATAGKSAGGRRVVCARNLHRSAVNALSLLGLEPVWVWPRPFPGSALPGAIRPEDVERALAAAGGAAAVYLTSPDYYGVLSDIRGIADVCARHGAALLVDHAHGAHLWCLRGGALHAVRQGADLCCDSAHKTLPVLTGGAWLQIGPHAPFGREEAKDAMALFGSTSPNYPVMLSLDVARAWMAREGEAAFGRLERRVGAVRALAGSLGFFTPSGVAFDPVRLMFDTGSVGVTGEEAAAVFRRVGVEPEMQDGRHLVLLPSPFNPEEDFLRAEEALRRIASLGKAPFPPDDYEPEHPGRAALPGEALRRPCEHVPVESAAGRVAAQAACPCPPGVPLVMPGERVSASMAKALKKYGVDGLIVLK